jgi:type IV pilus assembly protein PilY1
MKTSISTFSRIALAAFAVYAQGAGAAALNLGNSPLYLSSSVPPLVMLTVSKDHTLFTKAYNDFSDLDGDGALETSYNHSIDYAGYFDSYKCYGYDGTNNYYYPVNYTAKDKTPLSTLTAAQRAATIAANNTSKYCNTGTSGTPSGAKVTGTWSGNFLNWASMARIDVMRLVLYGGYRSSDATVASGAGQTIAGTLLERALITNDGHAWSKYYNGSDINKLTPFTGLLNTPPTGTTATNFTVPTTGTLSIATFSFNTTMTQLALGDQIRVEQQGNSSNFIVGTVTAATPGTSFSIAVFTGTGGDWGGSGTPSNSNITNLSRTGISICNTTDANTGYSQAINTATNAPLMRIASGNYALWNSNEVWQCQWRQEHSGTNTGNVPAPGYANSNGNRALQSFIPASAENPSNVCTETGLCASTTGAAKTAPDYTVRVAACVGVQSGNNLNGEEKCKQYPNGNHKPIGLLQIYGDGNLIQFGLMTGSYDRNISGGVLRKNVSSFQNEVNYNADGTFVACGTLNGIVCNVNKLRLYGYN